MKIQMTRRSQKPNNLNPHVCDLDEMYCFAKDHHVVAYLQCGLNVNIDVFLIKPIYPSQKMKF